MYIAIFKAIIELFKVLVPFLGHKLNEPHTAIDSPDVPEHYRDAWLRWGS